MAADSTAAEVKNVESDPADEAKPSPAGLAGPVDIADLEPTENGVYVSRLGYVCFKFDGRRVPHAEKLPCHLLDGSTYVGSISDGECHGQGVLTMGTACHLPTRDRNVQRPCVFEGMWQFNKQQGYGTHRCGDGHTYVGTLALSGVPGDHMWRRNGEGRMVFPKGDEFEGVWEMDYPVKGVMTFSQGGVHVGTWEQSKRVGAGVTTYANGDRFEGQWKDDRRVDGNAQMFYANGDFYEGQFSNERRHGAGKIIYSNGDVFEGRWTDDRPAQGHKSCLRPKQLDEHIAARKRAQDEADAARAHSRRPSVASEAPLEPIPDEVIFDRRHLMKHLKMRDGMGHLGFLTSAPVTVTPAMKTPRNTWFEGDDIREAAAAERARRGNRKRSPSPPKALAQISEDKSKMDLATGHSTPAHLD